MYRFTTDLGARLYEAVRELPIIDFHNHLNVTQLADGGQFRDLTQLWLESDPYKHRAMRILGVEERLITGDAPPYDKFAAWCDCFPQLTGNPLVPWSEMELKTVFGIDAPICPENGELIWRQVNEKLALPEYSVGSILNRFSIRYSAPCAAFADDLSVFEGLQATVPSLRGDTFTGDLPGICAFLQMRYGKTLTSFGELAEAIDRRMDEFHGVGCRISDHTLDGGWSYFAPDGGEEGRFEKFLRGSLTSEEKNKLDCDILRVLAACYAKRGWVMQLHMGAQRRTSTRLRTVAGPAGGYAAIGATSVEAVTALLDDLETGDTLPRTVLFCMESAAYDRLAVLAGSFNKAGHRGYVQLGPAWWWCDHVGGMVQVLESILHYGMLSTFIGMTTDSRSVLSFSRHDYFRRVLCNWLGEKVESGELAACEENLTALAKSVCYGNAAEYLGIS